MSLVSVVINGVHLLKMVCEVTIVKLSSCPAGIEIDDDQAEKIFTAGDAVEFLKVKLDIKS